LTKLDFYIQKRLAELEEKRIAKANEVMKYLTAVMRGEEKEEIIVVENIGDYESRARIINKQVSAKERIRAAELLGKRYALFKDNVNLSGEVGVQIIDDIELDDEE
jgi:phage terminase small subunit